MIFYNRIRLNRTGAPGLWIQTRDYYFFSWKYKSKEETIHTVPG